jgi:hypothetical protein
MNCKLSLLFGDRMSLEVIRGDKAWLPILPAIVAFN